MSGLYTCDTGMAMPPMSLFQAFMYVRIADVGSFHRRKWTKLLQQRLGRQ